MSLKEILQFVGTKVSQQFVFHGKGRSVGLSRYPDHFRVSAPVCFDVDLLKMVPLVREELARGNAPWAPGFHIKL